MIRIATPVSQLFLDAEAASQLMRFSDCLEGRENTERIAVEDQLLFHFEASIVRVWDENTRAGIRGIVERRPKLELASFHIASCCSDPVIDGIMFQSGGRVMPRAELLDNARINIAWLKDVLKGRPVKIAVENNNYYATAAYADVTEPSFISAVVRDSGIHFLLDTAHARISAQNMGMDHEQYLSGLPMDKTVQIHVSQWAVNDKGMAFDAHEIPGEKALQEVFQLIGKFGIEYLTVEYYRDLGKSIQVLKVCRKELGIGGI